MQRTVVANHHHDARTSKHAQRMHIARTVYVGGGVRRLAFIVKSYLPSRLACCAAMCRCPSKTGIAAARLGGVNVEAAADNDRRRPDLQCLRCGLATLRRSLRGTTGAKVGLGKWVWATGNPTHEIKKSPKLVQLISNFFSNCIGYGQPPRCAPLAVGSARRPNT